MCDYSLMSYRNRLAEAGEELESYRFPSSTLGFAAVDDLCRIAEQRSSRPKGFRAWLVRLFAAQDQCDVTAICLPEGSRLLLRAIPEKLQLSWGVGSMEEVRFLQVTPLERTHRDAILLPNGRQVSLQCLPSGLRARVVSLPTTDAAPPTAEHDVTDVGVGA